MSSEREKIEEQMRKMSFGELQQKHQERGKETKKRSFFKKVLFLLFWRIKVIEGILGINEKDIISSSSKEVSNHEDKSNHYNVPHNTENNFKKQYQFNPEEEFKREIAADAYFEAAGYDELAK